MEQNNDSLIKEKIVVKKVKSKQLKIKEKKQLKDNVKQFYKKSTKTFIVLLVIFAMLFTLIIPLSYSSIKENIFYITLGILGFFVISYWIYILLHAHNLKKQNEILNKKEKY